MVYVLLLVDQVPFALIKFASNAERNWSLRVCQWSHNLLHFLLGELIFWDWGGSRGGWNTPHLLGIAGDSSNNWPATIFRINCHCTPVIWTSVKALKNRKDRNEFSYEVRSRNGISLIVKRKGFEPPGGLCRKWGFQNFNFVPNKLGSWTLISYLLSFHQSLMLGYSNFSMMLPPWCQSTHMCCDFNSKPFHCFKVVGGLHKNSVTSGPSHVV